MARITQRLSARSVAAAQPHTGKASMLADGGGLYLHVSPAGSKSWVLRYRAKGRRHDLGLGPYPLVGLADARTRAVAQQRLRLDGVDPLAARRAARVSTRAVAATFRHCAEQYIDAHSAGWRGGKSESQWRQSLRDHVFPIFGDLAVNEVDTMLVLRAIKPIWNTKTETASRIRGRVESILGWATTSGYREGDNPARWKGHIENLLPKKDDVAKVEHHAALPHPEIAAFMVELRRQEGVAARALEFAILTASRAGEVVGARWSEFNIAERLWTVPGERMKAERDHRVPLSDAALAVIEKMPRDGDYIFPGGRPGRPLSSMALLKVLDRMGKGDLTVHGFRATFSTWAAERGVDRDLAEMALAHTVGSRVERAYQRSDLFQKRRQLAETWARYCAATSGKVVAIRA